FLAYLIDCHTFAHFAHLFEPQQFPVKLFGLVDVVYTNSDMINTRRAKFFHSNISNLLCYKSIADNKLFLAYLDPSILKFYRCFVNTIFNSNPHLKLG